MEAQYKCADFVDVPIQYYGLWVNRCLFGLCLITLGGLMYVTHKVFRLVRFDDPVLLLMIVFLQLTLVFYMMDFLF